MAEEADVEVKKTKTLFSPVKIIVLVGAVSLVLIGLVAFNYIPVSGVIESTDNRLEIAFASIDRGDLAKADELVAELAADPSLSESKRAAALFLQGKTEHLLAQEIWHPKQQKAHYLLAISYLKSSEANGLAEPFLGEAKFYQGKSLFYVQKYEEAIPLLADAIEAKEEWMTEGYELLATSYLRSEPANYVKAQEYNQKLLSAEAITQPRREQAVLQKAQILMGLEDYAECKTILEEMNPESPYYTEGLVIRTQAKFKEGDGKLANFDLIAREEHRTEADKCYQEGLDILKEIQERASDTTRTLRMADYLLGIGEMKLQNYQAAEQQLSRVRRLYLGTEEGIAAELYLARVQQTLGKSWSADAVEHYEKVLDEIEDPRRFENYWLTLEEVKEIVRGAYQEFYDSGQPQHALQIAKTMAPVFPLAQAIRYQGDVYLWEAGQLEEQVAALPPSIAGALQEQKRKKYRQAGVVFEYLAKLESAKPEYVENLWVSGESFLKGYDFQNASRVLKKYLASERRDHRPRALIALGETYLAIGNLDVSMSYLNECLEQYPRHPAVYNGRLLSAQAHLEKGNINEARQLLLNNLYNESLTPNSVEWRDSLFAYGELLYSEAGVFEARSRKAGIDSDNEELIKAGLKELEKSHQVYQQAIAQLSEALQRYPNAPQRIYARYLLADSYRQASKFPRKRLPTVTIQTTRDTLHRQMKKDLNLALDQYVLLIDSINEYHEQLQLISEKAPLTDLENRILRNSYFARGDVLFDLQEYDEASEAYSTFTNRYQEDPESLEAFVQIANCHRRLQQPEKAKGLLEQAKVVLKRMPQDAPFKKVTRYSRQEWEAVLEMLSAL